MNNRGVIGILMFFAFLFLVLILGFIASIVIGVVDFSSDTITPVMEDIGIVGATNVSEVAQYTFGVADTFIQTLPFIVGFGYVVALLFSIVFALSYQYNPNPVFMGLYFMLMVLLIIGAIVMSNVYENIYNQSNELSDRLNEQTLLSYMLFFSPLIFTIITFITGIYLFARSQEGAGGFGV